MSIMASKELLAVEPPSEPSPHSASQSGDVGDASKDRGGQRVGTMADKLRDFEAVMDAHYRGEPIEKKIAGLNQVIDEHNQWVKSTQVSHEATRKELEQESQAAQAIQRQIEEADRLLAEKPDRGNKAAVESYNTSMERRNKLVEQYNHLGAAYRQHGTSFDDVVTKSRAEQRVRQEKLSSHRADVEKQIAQHKQWFENGEDLLLFRGVNRLLAESYAEKLTGQTAAVIKRIDRARAIRREMAEHTIAANERASHGLLIVEATLCGQEKCFLVVDTGATTVTLPRSLVNAMGLSARLGKPVEARLAGGIKTTGRELVIPKISVGGVEAQNVSAVVLDEPKAGVDGLLGLSFLNRFDFQLDQRRPKGLILKPKSDK